jgi:hypothetical protein
MLFIFALLHAAYAFPIERVNELRLVHQSPPLAHVPEFGAQDWADYLASINNLVHGSTGFGENLAMTFNSGIDWKIAIDGWYAEGEMYNYSFDRFDPETGHFTQLVWYNSNMVDFGVATRGSATFYVARFAPPGNIRGMFLQNVFPPVGRSPKIVKPPPEKIVKSPPLDMKPPPIAKPPPKNVASPPPNSPPICNQSSCRPKRSCSCICS